MFSRRILNRSTASPQESIAVSEDTAVSQRDRWIPLAGGILALGLASLGEYLIESQNPSTFTLFCYLVAISIFVLSGAYLPLTAADLPAAVSATRLIPWDRRRWMILGGGVGLSVALNLVALTMIRHDLDRPDLPQSAGPWLWLISLVMIVATGVAVRRREGWSPLWMGSRLPGTERMRWLLAAFLAVLFIGASVARLVGLDRVPYGINADEGDRASTALQIIHGNMGGSIFGSGWYYISKVYFWLLAGWLNVLGFGYVQARLFGGVCSILTLVLITWIGYRHFSLRVALLAGSLGALLGVSLQFARETTEAAQTALLWTISMALLLEAARRGRSWLWIAAGVAGGLSIYFYPTGRLWGIVAAGFCAYLFVRGQGGHRWGIFVGAVLLGLAAFMTMGPFLANALRNDELSRRAQETSAFVNNNAVRLPYYDPHWSTAQLLDAQLDHSIGIFTEFPENGGFWPTQRPIMWGLITILTLLGLGWASLDWRDARLVALALWFWVGFVGVVATVETPDVQRMATAVPVLPLLSALMLDSLARRVEAAFRGRSDLLMRRVRRGATAAVALVAAVLVWQQGHFYFVDYAAMDRWPQPNILGRAVADQGPNALVVTVGRQFHMVNSGWVRLLAPHANRGGTQSPGSSFPLALPADHDLAFLIFPSQNYYLPYLQELYPGGTLHPYIHPTEKLVLTIYRVPRARVAARQGALATPQHGTPQRVPTLGAPPPGLAAFPAPVRWTAGLRISQYWNYSFRIGPGPARLSIDGETVLSVSAGKRHAEGTRSVTLALARGEHAIAYDGIATSPGRAALFEWKAAGFPAGQDTWKPVPTEALDSAMRAPRGLYSVAQVAGMPAVHRIDGTLATCCLRNELSAAGQPFTARWRGTLHAPVSGVYSMGLFSQGDIILSIDGRPVFHTSAAGGTLTGDTLTTATVQLRAGAHSVRVFYQTNGTPGALEWWWTPPQGKPSIVPPADLTPPPGAGVGPPVPTNVLGPQQPVDAPLVTIQ